MVNSADRELLRIRLRLIDLIKSFFFGEPDAEMLSRWRGIFAALVKQPAAPCVDGAAGEICRLLNTMSLSAIQREYAALFINQGNGERLPMTASRYLDGREFGMTLVRVREIMGEAGMFRRPGVIESEDSLPMLLDLFASLIEAEHEGRAVHEHRRCLLTEILLPMSQKVYETVEQRVHGGFYPACSRLLCGYLLLEKELIIGQRGHETSKWAE